MIKKAIFLLVIFILLVFAGNVYAHRLNVYAYAKDGIVHVDSYYSGKAKCKTCRVEVFDRVTGKKIAEGATDSNGMFLFKIKEIISLKIVINDRMGHRAEYLLDSKELSDSMKITGGSDAP
jgi:nickel transport protein